MNIQKLFSSVVATLILLGTASAAQATIIYNVNRAVGAGTVTGFFETDGTIGALTTSNFVDWSLTIQSPDINGGAATTSSLAAGSSLSNLAGGISATASDILFDFSGNNYLFWTYTTTNDWWCVAGSDPSLGCFVANAESIGYSDSTVGAAESSLYSGLQSIATASVPEPGTLLLLGFGLAGLAASRRSRQ